MVHASQRALIYVLNWQDDLTRIELRWVRGRDRVQSPAPTERTPLQRRTVGDLPPLGMDGVNGYHYKDTMLVEECGVPRACVLRLTRPGSNAGAVEKFLPLRLQACQ